MPNKPRILVVCARRYNGHELWTALGVMQESGLDFEVVSQAVYIEDEVTGQQNVINRTVYQVPLEELQQFDGLMIVSGNMSDTEAYWKDKHVLDMVKLMNDRVAPIAAICCSVPTIREAATGKKVSAFPLIRSKELLSRAGALYQTVALTVDQNLATAEHQMATQMWAEAYCRLVKGEEPLPPLIDSGYMPKGRSIRTPKIIQQMRNKRGTSKTP